MRKLNGVKQVDPDPLRIHTSTLETDCQTHCEAEVLCHGFTYHTGDRRCVLHRYNRHLVRESSCQYGAKTCPGYGRERTRVGQLNWIYTVVPIPSCKTMFSPSISWCTVVYEHYFAEEAFALHFTALKDIEQRHEMWTNGWPSQQLHRSLGGKYSSLRCWPCTSMLYSIRF